MVTYNQCSPVIKCFEESLDVRFEGHDWVLDMYIGGDEQFSH